MSEKEDDASLRGVFESAIEQVNAYFKELEGESPRAAVILSVAGLEDELENLIRRKFPDLGRTLSKKLFGAGLTPFGAYQSKADVAQAFGYYGPLTRAKLENIGSIRNKFAHSGRAIDFHNESVRAQCQGLGFGAPLRGGVIPPNDEMKTKFIHLVLELTRQLELHSGYHPELGGQPPDPLP